MNDTRAAQAQRLLFEVEALKRLDGSQRAIARKLVRMAQLHEGLAEELLQRHDADGWIDLFAAITAWAEAGSKTRARALLERGRATALQFDGASHLVDELGRLASWLENLSVVPALEDFARNLPPFTTREAA